MGGRDNQYSQENTQMPPASGFTYDGSRDGWRPPDKPDSDPYHKTLQLVLASFADRD